MASLLLALHRRLPLQRARARQPRRRQHILGQNASVNKRKGSPCQHDSDGDSQAKIMRCSIPDLPEDIWWHIHSLMLLCDAARAACVSRAFLRSWRCYPDLILDNYTLASETRASETSYSDIIDCILRNHSGCFKSLTLDLDRISIPRRRLDSWLRLAVKPGIEDLALVPFKPKYNVPCSLLSDGVRNSIRWLEIGFYTFRPTAELGPLRSLTSLDLDNVCITGNELEWLLYNARALEELFLVDCKEITHLRIPCVLQQLACLYVTGWWRLQVIENKAPNVSSFDLYGKVSKVLLGDALHMKNVTLCRSNAVHYARAELPFIVPNLETLVLSSEREVDMLRNFRCYRVAIPYIVYSCIYISVVQMVSTPMLPSKFLCLKHLIIDLRFHFSLCSYDYFSLVSFLDASPSLETLELTVAQQLTKHESVAVGGSSHLRQMSEHRHCSLKCAKIAGFSSAKALVELACYILKNVVSLEHLKLCLPKGTANRTRLLELAATAVIAIKEYIADKVPSTVQLTVREPCSRAMATLG